jgi:hypothetical protein
VGKQEASESPCNRRWIRARHGCRRCPPFTSAVLARLQTAAFALGQAAAAAEPIMISSAAGDENRDRELSIDEHIHDEA